ncbi:tyrosine recombinase, putative [Plasmodium malariae]|uniref:Tyrosine recombinase, putative n=1 Tax=Plasmodium malariae TaxID=5858 RepID=A0A1A8WEB5_PLAMA|nr:tyrosine recombinase, putative [Plasmodium malariae]
MLHSNFGIFFINKIHIFHLTKLKHNNNLIYINKKYSKYKYISVQNNTVCLKNYDESEDNEYDNDNYSVNDNDIDDNDDNDNDNNDNDDEEIDDNLASCKEKRNVKERKVKIGKIKKKKKRKKISIALKCKMCNKILKPSKGKILQALWYKCVCREN